MIVYEVRASLAADLVDRYRAWLDAHVQEILAIPGFRYAELHREDEGEAEATLVVRYHLDSRAALETYLREEAPRLRADGVRVFGDAVRTARRVTELMASYERQPR